MEIPRDRNGDVILSFFKMSVSSNLATTSKETIEVRAADEDEVSKIVDYLGDDYFIEPTEVDNGYNLKISARS